MKFTPKGIYVLILSFILITIASVTMFAVGTVARQDQTTKKTDINAHETLATQYVVTAFCKRFTAFEEVDLQAWNDMSRIEHKYPHPNPKDPNDNKYHAERRLALRNVSLFKKNAIKTNCESEVGKAISEEKKQP